MRKEGQGKVIPFRVPGRRRRRASVFLGALAVILLILALFAVEGGRNWDAVHRFFSYGSEELRFELDIGADVLGQMDNCLVTAGGEGVTAYTKKGTVRFMATLSLETPALLCSEKNVVAYDAGGTDFVMLSDNGTVLLQTSTEAPIFDVDLAPDGSACYVSGGDRVRSVLQVYDREQLPCYSVQSSTRYFSGCAVSEDADYVCAIALGQEDGLFASSALIYQTDRQDPVAEVSLGNQLIYDVAFWGKDRLCALGEDSLVVFSTEGETIGTVACEGVRDFDLGGDGFAVLVVPGEVGSDLIAVNRGARIVGKRSLGNGAAAIDAAGKYVACLTDGGLVISGQKLDPWYETQEIGAASQVAMCPVGTAYLLTAVEAVRYLP